MNLTKLQNKTIKAIGRWVDGHCTHSKALVTNKQLESLGIVEFKDDAVVLTKIGRGIYKELD